ncbi:MAG: hypothetical protein QXV69_00560 [Sulfolobaceae archaeon]
MPRRKSTKVEQKKESISTESNVGKRKSKSREKYVNPDNLLEEYLEEIILGLGLSYLNLAKEEYIELLKEPFSNAVGEVKTKPKSKTIINRLQANLDSLYEYFAMKLLMIKPIERMSDEQLEFIVYNIKKGLPNIIGNLYSELKKRNKDFLIDILRNNWNLYGIRSPIKCPKCQFYSIMPDLSCKVCNYVMSEKILKSELNIIELLREYMKLNPNGFLEIVKSGHFYYTEEGIISPSEYNNLRKNPQGLVFEIILTSSERKKLQELYNSHSIQS